MHVVYINLHGFYVRALETREPQRRLAPLIVHHNKQVLDVNKKAIELGARIGMTLTEAKALVSSGTFMAWGEDDYRLEQAEWLDICTEFSDRIEPGEQNEAYLDFSSHPDAASLMSRLAGILQRKHGTISFAMSPSKWIARYKAIHHDAPFENWSVQSLPVSAATQLRLEFLGYRTISAVKGLPLETLQNQFGTEGLVVYQAVRGGVIQEVQALYPPRAASSVYRFEELSDDEGRVSQAIGALAKKLSSRLVERDWQGSTVKLVIEGENGVTQVRQRSFSKPFQDYRSIFVALKMTLGRPDWPFECIRASLPQLVEAPRFQMEAGVRFIPGKVDIACEKVRAVYGDKSIAKAAEIPEPRRRAVLRAWKDVAAWQ